MMTKAVTLASSLGAQAQTRRGHPCPTSGCCVTELLRLQEDAGWSRSSSLPSEARSTLVGCFGLDPDSLKALCVVLG